MVSIDYCGLEQIQRNKETQIENMKFTKKRHIAPNLHSKGEHTLHPTILFDNLQPLLKCFNLMHISVRNGAGKAGIQQAVVTDRYTRMSESGLQRIVNMTRFDVL